MTITPEAQERINQIMVLVRGNLTTAAISLACDEASNEVTVTLGSEEPEDIAVVRVEHVEKVKDSFLRGDGYEALVKLVWDSLRRGEPIEPDGWLDRSIRTFMEWKQ